MIPEQLSVTVRIDTRKKSGLRLEGKSDDSKHINRIVRSRDTLKSRRGGMAVYDKVAFEDMALQANAGVVGGGIVLGSIVPHYTRIDAYYRSHGSIN